MTSASELFYTRRFRSPRNPEPALFRLPPAEADRDRDYHHHRPPRRQHRHRLHHHDCGFPRDATHGGPLPPPPPPPPPPRVGRHPCDRAPQTGYDIVWEDVNGTSESILGNNSNDEISSRNTGSRLATNDRLPGAVLRARARLFERLRGTSLTGSRQNASSSGISWDEFAISDDFRVVDSRDWETETPLEGLESASVFDLLSRVERSLSSPNQKEKKPPGLTREAINALQRDVFKDLGGTCGASKASLECCICLDKFCEGESLIRLSCSHRFHPECLDPWVQTCGDCPYCRCWIIIDPGAEHRINGASVAC